MGVSDGLVEALRALLDATDPYVDDAVPGETLFGPWAVRFERLCKARRAAAEALVAADAVQDRPITDEMVEAGARAIIRQRERSTLEPNAWDMTRLVLRAARGSGGGAVEAQGRPRPCKTCADRGGPDALTPCPTCNRYGPVVEGDEDRPDDLILAVDRGADKGAGAINVTALWRRCSQAETRVGELTRERDDAQELASEQITRAEVAEDRCRELEAALRELMTAVFEERRWATGTSQHADARSHLYLLTEQLEDRLSALSAAGEAGDRP